MLEGEHIALVDRIAVPEDQGPGLESTSHVKTRNFGHGPGGEGSSRTSQHRGHTQLIKARVRQRLFDEGPAPMLIGRFAVLEQIGQGGMGKVYAAYDEKLDRKVAVKVLLDGSSEQAQRRFMREAQAMARLSHPNVVTVHEVAESMGEVFLAMEFIHGQSLDEWVRSGPDWREVLAVFIQAGQGLIAAHEAGLVHRDLKPHNIMRTNDGVVKVLDFGLARAECIESEETIDLRGTSNSTASSMFSSLITRTGTMIGTPAYMSPEQLRGETADTRSDQFSFCVALYEALYGERPYEVSVEPVSDHYDDGASCESIQRSAMRPIPRGAKVPAGVRKVLLRGLAANPADRWSSMKVLLERLRGQMATGRRRWGAPSLAVALLGLGAWVGVGVDRYTSDTEHCAEAPEQLAGVWDQERRQAVAAAFLGTELSYAPETWSRVEQRLDEYAARWVDARVEACEATVVRREQSEGHMDLRVGCLHKRRQHLRATVDELAVADATVVENAVLAVTRLPMLSQCADMDALAAAIPPPADPVVADRVAVLDERLLEAEAKEQAGRYCEALVVAKSVEAEAAALDYEPLKARAWLRQGSLQEACAGNHEGAAATLRRAYDAAVAQGLATEAALASSRLVYILGNKLARYDESRSWAVHADPLSRVARSDKARAAYLTALSKVAKSEGKYGEARELGERALTITEEARGAEHPDVAEILNSLDAVASYQGRYGAARELGERALAIKEVALGPNHPAMGQSLHHLGAVASEQGRLVEARDLIERALVIRREALGPRHPAVARTLSRLGVVASLQGRYEEARERLESARTLAEQTMGRNHPVVARILNHLGMVASRQGAHDEARSLAERALVITERALGPEHPMASRILYTLGVVAHSQGELAQARQRSEQALELMERVLGRNHPDVAKVLTLLGSVRLELGERAEARSALERALILGVAGEGDPDSLALTRFTLAQALWAGSTDRVRALVLAEQARDALRTADMGSDRARVGLAEVEAWLRERSR